MVCEKKYVVSDKSNTMSGSRFEFTSLHNVEPKWHAIIVDPIHPVDLPLQMENGCNNSPGTFGMFTVNADYQIQQPLSQYFASRMINFEWLQHDGGEHIVYPATGTYDDGAHHTMVTAYSAQQNAAGFAAGGVR